MANADGLRRLYEKAVDRVMAMDISEAERQAMLAEIEAAFEQARAAGTVALELQYRPIPRKS